MKCVECFSCLKIIRIDKEGESTLIRFCPLCEVAYLMDGTKVEDQELTKLGKERYISLFGNRYE
jgi:hypothetical protein